MRLIKCYIDNFKGIDSKQIIDFEKNGLTLFDGPNGYGKTTIFETIELCVTGDLNKTKQRSNVTADLSDYSKAFFQNDDRKDVVLKVHFQRENGQDLIIIRHLPSESEGRISNERAFKPYDSLKEGIFNTYKGEVENFDSVEDFESLPRLSQQEINHFFYPNDENINLARTYLLFNYLQQEENIFFLKKSEHEKREELNFLFKTDQESKKREDVKSLLTIFKGIRDKLTEQLEKLKSQQENVDKIEHEVLFTSQELDFDKEYPYENSSLDEIDGFHERLLKKLEDLKDFIQNFDIDEFKKSKKREQLKEYSQNEALLHAFILSKYISAEEFEKIEKLKKTIDRYTAFLESEEKVSEVGDFLEEFEFEKELVVAYRRNRELIASLQSEAGELVTIINDLNDLRERLFKQYLKLRDHQHEGEDELANCPLCGTDFESIRILEESVAQKKENLVAAHKEKIDRITIIKDEIIENYVQPVSDEIEKFLSKLENRLEEELYIKIKESKEYEGLYDELKSFLDTNDIDLAEFKISDLKTNDELETILKRLKAKFSRLIDDITIDQAKLKNSRLLTDYFDQKEELLEEFNIDSIDKKRRYLESEYYTRRLSFSEKLEERLDSVKSIVDRYEAIKNIYEVEIRDFKEWMIDKVQVPFYLISGKILKHYPQGMGIFINFNKGNNSIRFLANNESDHDVVHHLSSGQLAVVSIAFCLALNKVYDISKQFRFLAIDDPVQTMDDINIHSLIELMRHGFKDYQILMSTHEDDVSRYINYKFKKFNFDVNRINVQEKFYS
ncbi:MAG: AAA family ATPase [Gracilimonas sp.]|uniref:AAA family ATPase n=1 Tax=Gracilimonas sp. TaxID=1974203 RepID=UPI0037533ACE|nr:AAA family ATPase [Gracilimonas sp.]